MKACRAEFRINSIESMSVPSRSKRIAGSMEVKIGRLSGEGRARIDVSAEWSENPLSTRDDGTDGP
jgi:hypothetical protein